MSSQNKVQGSSLSPQKNRNLKKIIGEQDASPTKIKGTTNPRDMLQNMIDAKRMQKNQEIT